MNKIFFTAFLIFILPLSFYSQNKANGTVKGKLTDLETKEPLIGAAVFLENTTFGTATDINGSYEIVNAAPGSYYLVISMVGYEIKRIPVRVPKGRTLSLDVLLKQKPMVLGQVNITGEVPEDWKEHLEVFKREFIGEGRFSGDVKVLNPEVINFRKDEDTKDLKAFTDNTIILENKALGYKVFVILQAFSYHINGLVEYRAYIRFEELKAEDDDEKAEWKENRLYCYLGSPRHFFYSIINKKLFDEGFRVREGTMITLSSGGGRGITEEDFKMEEFGDEFLRLNLYSGLKIEYTKKNSAVTYLNPDPPYFILFDKAGNRMDTNNMKLAGDWAEQRMAFALPNNYMPGD